MTDEMRDGTAPRLRAVGDGPVTDPATLAETAERCVRAAPGGLARRALGPAVAARLGLPADRVSPDALALALGLLIATGRVDESAGRLLAVSQERREAG